jgi:hypothetical protein
MAAFAAMTGDGGRVGAPKLGLLVRGVETATGSVTKVFCALFFKKALLSFLLQRAAAAAYGRA